MKDAITCQLEEACASGMGQRRNFAAWKDAKNILRVEEFARCTGQRSNYAVSMDALINLEKEDCA